MTYKGVTAPIEVIYEKLDADSHQYCENENLIPGAVISGVAKDNGIGHMWFYMGQFDSRDAVLDYLVKLGYNRDAVSPYVGAKRRRRQALENRVQRFSGGALSTTTPTARRDLQALSPTKLPPVT